MPALDPLVFDTTFDVISPVPTLLKVSVEPEHGKVVGGQTLGITIYIVNLTTTPGHRFLFNPSGIPKITIHRPDGVILITNADMVYFNVGVFTYHHTVSLVHPLGEYTASFSCVSGDKTMQTAKHGVFSVS
jgi:hypothetical protein